MLRPTHVLSTMTGRKPKQKPNKIVATRTLFNGRRPLGYDPTKYGTDAAKKSRPFSCRRAIFARRDVQATEGRGNMPKQMVATGSGVQREIRSRVG
jgi:hypothetical protein